MLLVCLYLGNDTNIRYIIELQISKNLIFMAGIQECAQTRAKVTGLNLCRPYFLADKLGKISSLFFALLPNMLFVSWSL